MTEEEAKTKWCPFALGRGFATEAAINRPFMPDTPDDLPAVECLCLGSACMAWRWRNGAFPLPNDPPSISGRYEGYCGLAGHP